MRGFFATPELPVFSALGLEFAGWQPVTDCCAICRSCIMSQNSLPVPGKTLGVYLCLQLIFLLTVHVMSLDVILPACLICTACSRA